ncbi:MAG: hypothetical protein AAFO94_08920 [Bacteroidota bacterium]
MRMIISGILLTLLLATPTTAEAQLLKGVMKRTEDKIRYGAQRMIVEKASDALANAVLRRAEREIDKAMRDVFAQQESEAREKGETPQYADYGSFLNAMNKSADVPASYTLDLQMLCEVSSRKEKPQEVLYHFSKAGGVFAFEAEEDGKKNLMVIDMEKDLMIMYLTENGKKTATALPGMMKLGMTMAKKQMEDNGTAENIGSMKATGNSKEVAGYNCKEFEYMYNKEKTLSYVTEDIDFSWPEAFGDMLKKFMPDNSDFPAEAFQGMALETLTFDKKGREDHKWTTKEVSFETMTIDNSEWEFKSFSESVSEEN